jgi:hypothetical protein
LPITDSAVSRLRTFGASGRPVWENPEFVGHISASIVRRMQMSLAKSIWRNAPSVFPAYMSLGECTQAGPDRLLSLASADMGKHDQQHATG